MVEVFVYSFALSSSPDFVFTESKEGVSSSVRWVTNVNFLDFAVILGETEVASDQILFGLFTRPDCTLTSTSRDDLEQS